MPFTFEDRAQKGQPGGYPPLDGDALIPDEFLRGGNGLPAGGTVGQVVTNTAPGEGDWEDPSGGSRISVFSFTQSSPSTTWTIAHNLGHYPVAITVKLLSGEVVEPDRADIDINNLTLSFSIPAAGLAELI